MTESIFSMASAGIAFAPQPPVRGPGLLLWSPEGDGDDDNIRLPDLCRISRCLDGVPRHRVQRIHVLLVAAVPKSSGDAEKNSSARGRLAYPRPTTQTVVWRRFFETFGTTELTPFCEIAVFIIP